MRRWLAVMFCMSATWAAVPAAPTDVQILEITHSSIYVDYASSEEYGFSRIRYGTTLSYDGGAGGGIAGQDTAGYHMTTLARGRPRGNLFALAPGTTYYGCVELSNDAVNWSTPCGAFSATTSALPAIHPVPPAAATEVLATRPDWSAWTPATASSCGDLQTKMNTASDAQGTATNSLIVVPYNMSCSALTVKQSGDYKSVTANSTTNVISQSSHGYSANQRLRFTSYALPTGIVAGVDYYLLTVDAGSYKISASPGGAEVDFTTDGSGVLVLPWPPSGPKVVVVNSRVYDATFLPEGVQLNPDWFSVMPKFIATGKGRNSSAPALDIDALYHAVHDWSFIGIEFTYPDTATTDILTTPDPDGHWWTVNGLKRATANIVLDQCYFHALPYPNRTDRFVTELNGYNNAIINSYFSNMDWWQAWSTSVVTKTNSTTAKISAGTYWGGPVTFTFPTDVIITLTGGTSTCTWDATTLDGCVIVYGTLDAHVHVLLPTGMTATCTGYSPCDVSTSATPALPMSGGKSQAVYFAVANLTSGAFDAFAGMLMGNGSFNGQSEMTSTRSNAHATNEGCAAIVAGDGPGPTTLRNNHIEGSGILAHWDDGYGWGGFDNVFPIHGDFVVKRNAWVSNPLFATGYPGSSGLRYGNRNQLEFKMGSKILVDGNTFTGGFADIHRTSNVPFTGAFGSKLQDVTYSNNVHYESGLGPGIPQLFAIYQPVGRIPKRALRYNNLEFNMRSSLYASNYLGVRAPGIPVFGGGGAEDVEISHNTWINYDGGLQTTLRWFQGGGVEGLKFTDNLSLQSYADTFTVEGSPYAHTVSPLCSGTSKQVADCNFRAGVGNPSYTFTGNVLIPGYTDSTVPTGAISMATFCTSLGGSWSDPNCTGGMATGNKLVGGTTVADRIAAAGLVGVGQIIDFTMRYASAYRGKDVPTTDGEDPGINVVRLKAALGLVDTPRALDITDTAATIAVTVHDGATGVACIVGYGTATTPPSWSRSSADTTASRFRSIALSGLSSATTYNYQVWCNGMAATETAQFQTR